MIEFAVVVIVKRKLELDSNESNGGTLGLKLGPKLSKERSALRRRSVRVGLFKGIWSGNKNERGEEIQKRRSEIKQHGFWIKLPATDKIDFVSLIVFLLCYFVFNCVYWYYYM